MNYYNIYKTWRFPLLLSILFSVLFFHFFVSKALVSLEINVLKTTWFKIYWSEDGKLFSEENMVRVRVRPGKEQYSFFLTDLRDVRALRIDTHQYPGKVVLKRLVIRQRGFRPVSFEKGSDFNKLKGVSEISQSLATPGGLIVWSTGNDPQFRYTLQLTPGKLNLFQVTISIFFIFLTVFAFFFYTENYRHENVFVPFFSVTVLLLVLVMATISKNNVHPDEYVHFGAVHYYVNNWLPPSVDDPAIINTYSVYGVSRLNSNEISYWLQGKFVSLLNFFHLSESYRARLFNVTLFGLLFFCLLRYEVGRLLVIPLLLSPQAWYIFSYSNSDAFALFISLIIAWQVVSSQSLLNCYLSSDIKISTWLAFLVLGLGFALLLLLKKNYYSFLVFLVGYLFWRNYFYTPQDNPSHWYKRLALIVALGISISCLWVGTAQYINSFDRNGKIIEMKEKLADPLYKPSTPIAKKHLHLYRKARGETLEEFIKLEQWFEKTFRSSFGCYGYFTVSASDSYYSIVRWLWIVFLSFCIIMVLWKRRTAEAILLAYFFCCAIALISVSFYHSWTADFQPQGRYLFPILAMGGIVLYHLRPLLPSSWFRFFLLALFSLSLYSFIFVALPQIPKDCGVM